MGDILSGITAERWITGMKRLERHGATMPDWMHVLEDEDQARRVSLTLQRRKPLSPTAEYYAGRLFEEHRMLGTARWEQATDWFGGELTQTAKLIPVDECDLFMTDQLDPEKRLYETCRLMYIGCFGDGSPVTIATCMQKRRWMIQSWWPDSPWPEIFKQPYAQAPLQSGWYLVRQADGPVRVPKWEHKPRRIMLRQARAVEYFYFVWLDRYLGNYTHLGPDRPEGKPETCLAICRDENPDGTEITTAVGTIPNFKSEIVVKEIGSTVDDNMGVGMVAYLG